MAKRRIKSEDSISLQNNKDRDRFYNKMNDEQKLFFNSIQENIFTFCEATSGVGKTQISVAAMVDMLYKCQIDRIIYIQKVSQRFLQNGFLPGTIEEKTQDLWTPFYDSMLTLGYIPDVVDRLVNENTIILTTDSSLRGINIEKSGVIIDEAENCNIETLRLIFTRCHDNCHVVMLGDSLQKDNVGKKNKDFIDYGEFLANSPLGNKCTLTKNYRGKFSQLAESYMKV